MGVGVERTPPLDPGDTSLPRGQSLAPLAQSLSLGENWDKWLLETVIGRHWTKRGVQR